MSMAYSPAALVAVPVVVPFRMTVAPITGAPLSSVTRPFTVRPASAAGRVCDSPPRLAVRTIFSPLTSIFTLGSTSAMIEAMLRLTAFTDTRLSGLMSASM